MICFAIKECFPAEARSSAKYEIYSVQPSIKGNNSDLLHKLKDDLRSPPEYLYNCRRQVNYTGIKLAYPRSYKVNCRVNPSSDAHSLTGPFTYTANKILCVYQVLFESSLRAATDSYTAIGTGAIQHRHTWMDSIIIRLNSRMKSSSSGRTVRCVCTRICSSSSSSSAGGECWEGSPSDSTLCSSSSS